ncbi:MAG: hypothetical protein ACOYVG_14965 [Bacteroidota bacterium]
MKGDKLIRSCCIILGLLLMGGGSLSAQTTHYLFFQTENNKPFYLRLMGTMLSSNASGYLLIPKITDGKYEIHIGFARSETEQQFEVTMDGKDIGFSLKQELDNSWSLFNLVDFSQNKGKTVAVTPPQIKVEEEPAVLNKTKEEEKTAEKKEVKQADTASKTIVQVKEISKTKKLLPQISKIYDRTSVEGIDMVFVVNGTPKSDTVIIYVPAIKPPGMAGKSLKNRAEPDNKGAHISNQTALSAILNPSKKP